MDKAIAIANNDTVFLSWTLDQKIEGCLGFAVYRKDPSGARTALPAWVGFKGGSNPDWVHKDTTIWPVQKFNWRDFAATRGQTYTYDIVPMTGSPGNLQPVIGKTLTTGAVTLSPKRGSFSVYFTNGILATQALTHVVPAGSTGAPSSTFLRDHIGKANDPIRMNLAGQVLEGMTALLDRAAKEGGSCYAALYELEDDELVSRLLQAKSYLHLILGNTGVDDSENHPARQKLHDAGVDITDRMVAKNHIAHNKFCLYCDASGTPRAVLTGSTNWTSTGVCTQSNNSTIVEHDDVAAAYLDYWKRIKADDSKQGPDYRKANQMPHPATVDGTAATVWFSPNTMATSKGKALPVDMKDVFAAMAKAKQAIIFLVFQPGSPSIVEYAAACENAKPGLLVYGAATDPRAKDDYTTLLVHRSTKNTEVVHENTSVVSATGVNTEFAYWHKEILKLPGAHAIIHDKIVVIDPMTPDCVVIFGSHNQGYRASYANDENFIIVHGHQQLAAAYATHVMDVYDHYRWRFTLKTTPVEDAFSGLDPTPAWQDKYYKDDSDARREALFWTGQLPELPDAPAPAVPTQPVKLKTTNGKNGNGEEDASPPKRKKNAKAPTTAKAKKAKSVKKTKPAKKTKAKKTKKTAAKKTAKMATTKKTTAKKKAPKKKTAAKKKTATKKKKSKKSRSGSRR
jgi:phosphatidylserine/phosphatidylglycerophosphate/cardiolipin synthase-like enzyme